MESNIYYQDESATIYCGDCREILPSLEAVDLVLTDPPYGINVAAKKNVGGTINIKRKGFGDYAPTDFAVSEWDKTAPSLDTLQAIILKAKNSILWGGNYFGLQGTSGWLVWDKDNAGTNFADCELAWTNLKMAVRKFKWRWNGLLQEDMRHKEIRQHPTQKPLALMKWCLSLVPDAKTVLDPFMGSGTTLRACKDLGLHCVGIEREEKYCEIAAKRLAQESLFSTPQFVQYKEWKQEGLLTHIKLEDL